MKPIFISLSPNTEKDDLALVFRFILRPWLWREEKTVRELEEKFKTYLNVKYAFAFNSGRSAFFAILNALELEKDSEILIQGFTCNALVNPILWTGLKPVYVDVKKETLNIDPADIERKITEQSRAVIVQHTFGLPSEMDEILKICQRHNLILIEDCAHSLGANYKGKKIGTFGKASFFSFGRDKVISSVYGGAAATNDPALAEKLNNFQEKLPNPSCRWILQQLLHPILTNYIVMPLYNCGELGRLKLLFLQKLGILSKAVHKKEKIGLKPKYIPQTLPGVLAKLALHQLSKLEKFNLHRAQIAEFYYQALDGRNEFVLPKRKEGRIYLRFPVILNRKSTNETLFKARARKIFLDDGWRKAAVMPPDTNQEVMGYKKGECPAAERTAENIVNLPTHINIGREDAEKITGLLKGGR